jgi:hypothetical protein
MVRCFILYKYSNIFLHLGPRHENFQMIFLKSGFYAYYLYNPCHSHFFNHSKGKSNVTFRGHMALPSTKLNLGHPFLRFLDKKKHTHIHTRQNLSEKAISSSFARDTTYTTQNKHKRRTFMPSAGFESAIPAFMQTQT